MGNADGASGGQVRVRRGKKRGREGRRERRRKGRRAHIGSAGAAAEVRSSGKALQQQLGTSSFFPPDFKNLTSLKGKW